MAQAMMLDAEGHLRELALAGDDRAFESLVGPLIEPAVRMAFEMLGDRAEAEDAVQDAVTSAWRHLRQLRPAMPVRPWFLAIVANRCRNVRRGRWFRTILTAERAAVPPAEPRPEHIDLERALERLRAADRQAIFLFFYLDLPLDEVAAVLGVSVSAARGRIYRACRRLRPGLVEEEI